MSDAVELASTPSEVRRAAMDLLARRDHTRMELCQKLGKRFSDRELIEQQIDRLSEENLQSDARCAESFVRQYVSRGQGPRRIYQALRHKGVADDDVVNALAVQELNWAALAEIAYRRKFGESSPEDFREKARRGRFMQYRGFELEHFRHLLG